MKINLPKIKLPQIKIVIALLVILLAVNIAIITHKKSRPSSLERINEALDFFKLSQKRQSEYFDLPCPEIEFFSTKGEKIALRDLEGDLIIIRFSRFDLKDLPDLLYLDHLYESLKKEKIHLFFIQLFGKKYFDTIDDLITFSVPVIEDDGFISSAFQAGLYETIIIGKDFKIKLKNRLVENRTIYNLVLRYLFENSKPPLLASKKELGSLIKRISFRNLENGKIENLWEKIRERPTIINISISTCFGCPENTIIRLMNGVASREDVNKEQIIILFGRNNNFNLIKNAMEKKEVGNITIGIIQKSYDLSDEEYYRIFKLDVDPRMVILNKNGEIIFLEDLKNKRKINLDFLINKLT